MRSTRCGGGRVVSVALLHELCMNRWSFCFYIELFAVSNGTSSKAKHMTNNKYHILDDVYNCINIYIYIHINYNIFSYKQLISQKCPLMYFKIQLWIPSLSPDSASMRPLRPSHFLTSLSAQVSLQILKNLSNIQYAMEFERILQITPEHGTEF